MVGDVPIIPSKNVRNLGIIFDSRLTMEPQINSMCRRAYYHLHGISRIRKFLSDSAAAQLVHTFVTSTLDYGNSLLVGLPSKRLDKLQHDHISDVLINFHWLPVSSRITFKIATQTYRCINNCAPVYLSELISRRKFRSSLDLILPKTKQRWPPRNSFAKMAPKIWNSISLPIRSANGNDTLVPPTVVPTPSRTVVPPTVVPPTVPPPPPIRTVFPP
jgi:hypothetical protein